MPSEELIRAAQDKAAERNRARRDDFFLANDVLGFDFQPGVHAELFACFPRYDPGKSWVEQSEQKDRLILWPRGHYKTTAVVVAIVKAVLNFPNIRILIMQGSLQVTKTLLHQIFSHFSGEAFGSRLTELFPEFCGERRALKASATSFTTRARTMTQLAQATVTVASPKSIKTGQHYDAGFFDDVINESNYLNPPVVERAKQEFSLAQPLIDPGCYRFVSGTRYGFLELYGSIIDWNKRDGKWLISVKDCWRDGDLARPETERIPRFPQFRKKTGELGGFTAELLLQMQRDDPAMFACQYLNQPVALSKQAFTEEMLHGACIKVENAPALSQPMMMIDLASSEYEHSDDSVLAIGQMDTLANMYVTALRGGQWTPLELTTQVIDMAMRYRPVRVKLEKTPSAVFFADYLRVMCRGRNIFIPVELFPVNNRRDAKNLRVTGFAGVVKRGLAKFYSDLPGFDKLIEQAIQFPKGRWGHDDWIDCVSLLWQELSREYASLPIRATIQHPILALMADMERVTIPRMSVSPREDHVTTGLD